MSDKKLYSDKRWTDIPKAKVIGYREMTPEEQEEANKTLERIIKKMSGHKD